MPVKRTNRSKTSNTIDYDVGNVGVEVNHSHKNKLILMKMTMENWSHNEGKNHSIDSQSGRMYEADLHKVNQLLSDAELNDGLRDCFLTKKDMQYLNVIFKAYGGKRRK
jgi:hypothetical protein